MTVDAPQKAQHRSETRPPRLPSIIALLALSSSIFLYLVRPVGWDLFVIHGLGWVSGAWIPLACLVWHQVRVRTLRWRKDFTIRNGHVAQVALPAFAGWVFSFWHGYDLVVWWAGR